MCGYRLSWPRLLTVMVWHNTGTSVGKWKHPRSGLDLVVTKLNGVHSLALGCIIVEGCSPLSMTVQCNKVHHATAGGGDTDMWLSVTLSEVQVLFAHVDLNTLTNRVAATCAT